MRNIQRVLIGIVGVALNMVSANAVRADRKIVILIDATGSMMAIRKNPACADPNDPRPECAQDPDFPTRYAAAVAMALDMLDLASVDTDFTGGRVFIFQTLGAVNGVKELTGGVGVPGNTGWYTAVSLRNQVDALKNTPPPLDALTPLAYSMCKAGDAFAGVQNVDTSKELYTFTDGGENNSDTVSDPNNCYFVNFGMPTWDWQKNVRDHLTGAPNNVTNITASSVLFTNVAYPAAFKNTEAAELARLGRSLAPSLLSDADFLRNLATATGGTFTLVGDTKRVPMSFGDVNGDFVVNRSDAIALARKFGQPADPRFDLNRDGVIGFDDYRIVVSRLSQPDPYVTSGPVSCKSASQEIVIDGRAVEDGGITIDAHNSCKITIRNSLVVSGRNAITIVGEAKVTVDNSIIVGEQAVIVLRGEATLSAANSIFHGKTETKGRINYIDRGGNTWE